MGDVEDLLGELEDEDETEKPEAKKGDKKKRYRSQDDFELDLDKAWGSGPREE